LEPLRLSANKDKTHPTSPQITDDRPSGLPVVAQSGRSLALLVLFRAINRGSVDGALEWCKTQAMIRCATAKDFAAIQRLYTHLNPSDPPITDEAVFREIITCPGLDLLLLETDAGVVATTYLNVIPNLSRSARPYACCHRERRRR